MMGFILRFLPSFAPMLGPLLNPWVLLAFVVWSAGCFGYGLFTGKDAGARALAEHIAQQATARVALIVKQGELTERVVNHYVKVKGDTQTVTVTVEKEVSSYANTGYCLDGTWRRLHDAAALNGVPPAAGPVDGEGGAPQAATAIRAVTENYAACHRTADKLDSLQQWVNQQKELTATQ